MMNPAWAMLKEIFIKICYGICMFYYIDHAYSIWRYQKQERKK